MWQPYRAARCLLALHSGACSPLGTSTLMGPCGPVQISIPHGAGRITVSLSLFSLDPRMALSFFGFVGVHNLRYHKFTVCSFPDVVFYVCDGHSLLSKLPSQIKRSVEGPCFEPKLNPKSTNLLYMYLMQLILFSGIPGR